MLNAKSQPLEPEPLAADPTTAILTKAGMAVPVSDVASRLGKTEAELTPKQRTAIVNAIIDAQAVVEGEIHRPLVPVERAFSAVEPYAYAPGGALDPRSWPVLSTIYDDIVVVSARARVDGTFDLVVRIGLDGSQEEPIRAFIRAHATEAVRLDPGVALGQLAVTSVSVEGQSISYEKRSVQQGAAGALPTLSSLRRYKRLGVYQAPSRVGSRWPYIGGRR